MASGDLKASDGFFGLGYFAFLHVPSVHFFCVLTCLPRQGRAVSPPSRRRAVTPTTTRCAAIAGPTWRAIQLYTASTLESCTVPRFFRGRWFLPMHRIGTRCIVSLPSDARDPPLGAATFECDGAFQTLCRRRPRVDRIHAPCLLRCMVPRMWRRRLRKQSWWKPVLLHRCDSSSTSYVQCERGYRLLDTKSKRNTAKRDGRAHQSQLLGSRSGVARSTKQREPGANGDATVHASPRVGHRTWSSCAKCDMERPPTHLRGFPWWRWHRPSFLARCTGALPLLP